MNIRVDVIVIGDSKAGHEILDKIASSNSAIKLAFISQTFKSTTTHDYVNVNYFREEVAYVGYRHRLFCCYLNNGNNIFGTHLVIASGLNYAPLIINGEAVPNVFNTVDEVPKLAKDQPAVVICNNEINAKFAIDVAKKYKQVYLCTNDMLDNISTAVANKLSKIENIAVLQNTAIKNIITKDNTLYKVELDSYSELSCAAIFVKTEATPAIEFVPTKILLKDENNYPVLNNTCESTIVQKCYAAGNCVKKYTKAMEQRLVDAILADF